MEKEIVPVMKQFVIKPQNKQNFLIRNCTILSNMEMENGCITLPVTQDLGIGHITYDIETTIKKGELSQINKVKTFKLSMN